MSIDSEKDLNNKKISGGYSYAEKHSILYTWEINEVSQFLQYAKITNDEVYLDSPDFSTAAKMKDSWFLELEIKNDEGSKNKTWISIYLMPGHGGQKAWTRYLFFILNNKKEKITKDLKVYDQVSDSSDLWCYCLFENLDEGSGCQFMKIDELLERKEEFLVNDTLTICIDLDVYDEYVSVNNSTRMMKTLKRKMRDDFSDLLAAKKKCDITIIVGEEKFDAHKFILTARSSVFEVMISHNLEENKENEVIISDIDPKIFKKVLEYIYTDKVDQLSTFAEELLEAADKFQLLGLKEMCEHSLAKVLTLDNAVKMLILADRFNAKKFKTFAVNFVANHSMKLKSTDEFKVLEQEHPNLLLEVLKQCLAIEGE